MARLIYEDGVDAIRGHRGNTVLTLWKGIPTARLRPLSHRYPWESKLNEQHRNETSLLVHAWRYDLSGGQKAGWATYADYLAELPTDYAKIPGWKQYGGPMSPMDAFILTNSLRYTIWESDVTRLNRWDSKLWDELLWGSFAILEDAPLEEESPSAPNLDFFEFFVDPPKRLVAGGVEQPDQPPDTMFRLWLRGKRYAHLLLAFTGPATGGIFAAVYALNYAQGNTLPIQPDIYQAQMDAVTHAGRFSPPSVIKTVQTY